jgi:hypothetical protein
MKSEAPKQVSHSWHAQKLVAPLKYAPSAKVAYHPWQPWSRAGILLPKCFGVAIICDVTIRFVIILESCHLALCLASYFTGKVFCPLFD